MFAGDQEVLDIALVDVDGSALGAPPGGGPPVASGAYSVGGAQGSHHPPETISNQRPSIDDMIQRLALEQDQRLAHERRPDLGEQPGPSEVRERRESSSSRHGERRASSGGPPTDHSYAVATPNDPLSPRGS